MRYAEYVEYVLDLMENLGLTVEMLEKAVDGHASISYAEHIKPGFKSRSKEMFGDHLTANCETKDGSDDVGALNIIVSNLRDQIDSLTKKVEDLQKVQHVDVKTPVVEEIVENVVVEPTPEAVPEADVKTNVEIRLQPRRANIPEVKTLGGNKWRTVTEDEIESGEIQPVEERVTFKGVETEAIEDITELEDTTPTNMMEPHKSAPASDILTQATNVNQPKFSGNWGTSLQAPNTTGGSESVTTTGETPSVPSSPWFTNSWSK